MGMGDGGGWGGGVELLANSYFKGVVSWEISQFLAKIH